MKHIPNTLTCISLAFGFYASVLGLSGNYCGAMMALFAAAVFDFADGLAARLLKAYSPMGRELDSLADIISFGVAPGMMLFSFLDKLIYALSWNDAWAGRLLLLSAFAIPVFSGLRLAKFNIDERQKTSFIGLPVPAHAILWASLLTAFSPAVIHYEEAVKGLIFSGISPEVLLVSLPVCAVATSFLLVSGIPMFSLKISSFAWKENRPQYILVLSAILSVTFLGIIGISVTILLYILLSVMTRKIKIP
ncbi:MAG: CDP-alcohol phosphatidyltransferase family protein [Tannerella sp.]|jgi:CDP-diacylglycerol--serine O-phosphatidyltransferase|nr:CDP-alcohol phosphatidyltransferase family protein [Tannerella sp.]